MKKLLILTIVLLSFPTSAFAAIGFMPSSDSAEIEYEVELKFYDEDGELLDEDKSTIRTTNQSLNRFNYSCNII